MKKRSVLGLLLALILAWMVLTRLDTGYHVQGKQQLEEAIRRTAVTCYASEGFYPPSLSYMKERYGLQYDQHRYEIRYEIFASNLMPEITVLEAMP